MLNVIIIPRGIRSRGAKNESPLCHGEWGIVVAVRTMGEGGGGELLVGIRNSAVIAGLPEGHAELQSSFRRSSPSKNEHFCQLSTQ